MRSPVITNPTSLSAKISARVAKEKGMSVIFLESICNDPAVIAANVALKVSSGDPDYKDLPRKVAERDFLRRIKEYEAVYETITEPHLSYLRITDIGNEVTLSRINGYLQSRIAFYLMNLHVKPRNIFLSRVRRFRTFQKLNSRFCRSTARASIMSKAGLAGTRCFQNAASHTLTRSLSSYETTSVMHHLLYMSTSSHGTEPDLKRTGLDFDPSTHNPNRWGTSLP